MVNLGKSVNVMYLKRSEKAGKKEGKIILSDDAFAICEELEKIKEALQELVVLN